MSMWDTRYASEEFVFGTQPNDFLVEGSAFLPAGGHVVSLGEGEGRNGVWLAERGFRVTAIDGSAMGLEKAVRLAASRGVKMETVVGDLEEVAMKKNIWCQMANRRRFQIGEIPLRRGTINFKDNVCLVGLPGLRLSLHCGWSSLDPNEEPWYLLTPFRAGKNNLERYSRRFWIEEMFRRFQRAGFSTGKDALGERQTRSHYSCVRYFKDRPIGPCATAHNTIE